MGPGELVGSANEPLSHRRVVPGQLQEAHIPATRLHTRVWGDRYAVIDGLLLSALWHDCPGYRLSDWQLHRQAHVRAVNHLIQAILGTGSFASVRFIGCVWPTNYLYSTAHVEQEDFSLSNVAFGHCL